MKWLKRAGQGLDGVIAKRLDLPYQPGRRAMQKYKGCHWTDEMGKSTYECIKRNDGFGTHWCYDEALEQFCPAQLEAAKKADSQPAGRDKPAR